MIFSKKVKNSKKVIFLASGRGSNFKSCVDSIKRKKINATAICLITDNPSAKAIQIAQFNNIKVEVLDYKQYKDKKLYHKDLFELIFELCPDLIVTAGYMRILKNDIVKKFQNCIINIHPSLLPAFKGINAQEQAIEYGVKVSGCTAHFIDEGIDTGPIILQEIVKIDAKVNSTAILSKKILELENKILPEALRLFCEDKLKVVGRKVKII